MHNFATKNSFKYVFTGILVVAVLLGRVVESALATSSFPSFPSCQGDLSNISVYTSHLTGMHQIVGGDLLEGSDFVYNLGNGNFLQCFCPTEGDNGIQTNWFRTDLNLNGWFSGINGTQWNLGNFLYAAKNFEFNCNPEATPTPTPTATPTSTPTRTPTVTPTPTALPTPVFKDDGGDGLGCAVNDCSGNKVEPPQGQVLGTSTMAGVGSFAENFYLSIIILGETLLGLGIKSYKKV